MAIPLRAGRVWRPGQAPASREISPVGAPCHALQCLFQRTAVNIPVARHQMAFRDRDWLCCTNVTGPASAMKKIRAKSSAKWFLPSKSRLDVRNATFREIQLDGSFTPSSDPACCVARI